MSVLAYGPFFRMAISGLKRWEDFDLLFDWYASHMRVRSAMGDDALGGGAG